MKKKKTSRSNWLYRPAVRVCISDGFALDERFEKNKILRHGCVCLMFMHVVPIKSKPEGDVASGMIECLHKMETKSENNLERC